MIDLSAEGIGKGDAPRLRPVFKLLPWQAICIEPETRLCAGSMVYHPVRMCSLHVHVDFDTSWGPLIGGV